MTGFNFALSEILIEHLGWVLLHSIWQFTAIASLVFVANRLLQKASATARYVSLLAGLFLMTATPVVTWFVLPKPVEVTTNDVPMADITLDFPSQHDVPSAYSGSTALPAFNSQTVEPSLAVDRAVAVPATVSADENPPAAWFERLAEFLRPWLSTIVVVWCGGVLLFSIRPLWSWLNVRRLRKVGTSPVAESVRKALKRIAERLQVTRRVEILASTVVSSPIVVGCFRSVILLPASFIASVPTSQLEAILAHELAHVCRHDYLVNLLQTLIETLFFYHPAVWWLSHCIRIERENCCDDLVVSTFGNKSEYGRALLAVEEFRAAAITTSAPGLALNAKGGSLLDRVRRLVNTTTNDESAGNAGVATFAVLTIAIGGVAFWFGATTQAKDETVNESPASESFVATIAEQISVELLAIQQHNDRTRAWQANGAAFADAAKLPEWKDTVEQFSDRSRHLLFRWKGLEDGPNRTICHIPGQRLYVYPRTDGTGGISRLIAEPTDEGDVVSVKVGLTDIDWGPWQTVDKQGKADSIDIPAACREVYAKMTPLHIEERTNVSRFCWPGSSLIGDSAQFHVVAVKKDGTRRDYDTRTRSGAPPDPEYVEVFLIPLSEIDHFEYRLRPYRHWVTFENVSLQPGKKTEVKVLVETIGDVKTRLGGGLSIDEDSAAVVETASPVSKAAQISDDELAAKECINLRGICRNEKGEALEGVWIRVYGGRAGAGRMDKTAEVARAATDREGKFHVTAQLPPFLSDLPEDSVSFVAVFSLNRGSSVVMKSWTGAAIDDNLEVTISGQPFTLRGTVIDEKGKPIQGASLFVRNGLNVDIPASHNGLTNVEGQFEIPGLQREEGKGFLCVYHPDYGQKQVMYQHEGVSSPLSNELNIILEAPGVLSGTVIDAITQRPQANCIVTAQTTRDAGFGQGVTDSFGHYLLRVPAGDYVVAVGGRPYSDKSTETAASFSVQSGQTTEVAPLLFNGAGLRRVSDGNSAQFEQKMSEGQPTESSSSTVTPQQFGNLLSGTTAREMQEKVTSLLAKLKQQQEQDLTGKDEWALTMKSLIELGPGAVPALSEALDQTAQDDRLMLRSIPFVLRGIGDKRAVPALIRAIPKCFGADGSDMGYLCEDANLLKFMQQHDSSDSHDASRGPERTYSYGRPVNEVFLTLEKWTKHKDRLRQLHNVTDGRSMNPLGRALGQRLYNQAALEWQSFWEANRARFITDEAFANVGVQLVNEPDAGPSFSRDVRLHSNSGSGNNSLESVFSVSGGRWDRCFSDLDTGLDGCLPERFLKLSRGERLAQMDEIVAEAAQVGFDLMGSEMIQDGKSVFVLQPIGLEVWEISKEVYEGKLSIAAMIEQGRRVNNVIAHFDEDSGQYDLRAAAYFFMLTREGTPIKMLLGVPITSTNFVGGPSDHTRDEFQHTGFQPGRRFALSILKPDEMKSDKQ